MKQSNLYNNQNLEVQWTEPVSLTCRTNQKQELPIAAMFANGSKWNEQYMQREARYDPACQQGKDEQVYIKSKGFWMTY
jgi:hypothetical protein